MNLDEFIAETSPAPRRCAACIMLARLPGLDAEIREHRARANPTSWEKIGAYVRAKFGFVGSGHALRDHYVHHTKGVL